MVLLWSPKFPAIHCRRMLTININILMPSLSSPWPCSPWWPDTKEKSSKMFTPDQDINRKKSRSQQQTLLVTTNQPRLAPIVLKKKLFRLNKQTNHVTDMSNKWIVSIICPINKTEKKTFVKLVAFLFFAKGRNLEDIINDSTLLIEILLSFLNSCYDPASIIKYNCCLNNVWPAPNDI